MTHWAHILLSLQGEIPEKSNGKDFFELPVFSYHDGECRKGVHCQRVCVFVHAWSCWPRSYLLDNTMCCPAGYLSTNISANYFFSSQRHAEVPRLTQVRTVALAVAALISSRCDAYMPCIADIEV